jgi:hypothetical protein
MAETVELSRAQAKVPGGCPLPGVYSMTHTALLTVRTSLQFVIIVIHNNFPITTLIVQTLLSIILLLQAGQGSGVRLPPGVNLMTHTALLSVSTITIAIVQMLFLITIVWQTRWSCAEHRQQVKVAA